MKFWLIYLVVTTIHQVVVAGQSADSKFTPWYTTAGYVCRFWPSLLTRYVLGTILFYVWWDREFAQLGVFPLTPGTAAIYGWFSDSIIDKALNYISTKYGLRTT